ncbi:hypothetical protein BBP40_006934 [Aspergillus hancockii]|nr:hypothetical protein BBP40_006934 [Aspergillus hancockii]
MPPETRKVMQRTESVGEEKRKPVRRDPERRRQQNIQAQRKYREKLRERRSQLEALASSAALGQGTLAAGTDPSEVVPVHSLSRTPSRIIANGLPATEVSEVSVSSSSEATPGDPQQLIPLSDSPSALSIWNSAAHIPRSDDVLPISDMWDCTTDPYATNLRMESICTISALYTLGMHIGITEEMLCSDDSLSPFFRFSKDDMIKASMVYTVQRIFKTLKPDLRPTREQITVQHHPYIDILPFPTLRNNLITHQGEVDEDEFFHDMLTGLVCWGGAGIGKKDREISTGSASTGTPWDVRSWEARGWFLKKYWTLLGGEDGELVRQSEWWRSIRGEDMEVHSQK